MSTKVKATKTAAKASVASLTSQLTKLGLVEMDLPANATTQTKKFFDAKNNRAFITFSNGHVARTVEGENGKRYSLNPTKEGAKVMIMTEPARLKRILAYVQGDKK